MTAAPISRYDGSQAGGESRPVVRLTADRVRRWRFEASSFARRGYDQEDVDRFRVQVADELDHLAIQVADLRAENERLNDHVEMYRHGVMPSAQISGPSAKEINLLTNAQREAEQVIAQAHEYARQVAEYAREQYENYMQAAVEQAREEAQRAMQSYQPAPGGTVDDSAQEALRIFGEMMISHMQAAARHLDNGCENLARTMDRLGTDDGGGGRRALPR